MFVVGGQPKKHSNTSYETNRAHFSTLWLIVFIFVMSDPTKRE